MSPVPEEGEHDAKPSDHSSIDNLPLPDVFINVQSSDSEDDPEDEEGNGFQGYQMLPQDVDDDDTDLAEDSPEDEINASQIDEAITNSSSMHVLAGGGTPSYMQVPELPKPDPDSLLWNQKVQDSRIKLDQENAEKIKHVMKHINLPQCNIPEWARNIPEDQWRERISKIQDTNS